MLSAALLALFTAATSCYHLPVWRGAVVVHPLDRAAIARCGTGALTREGEKIITREPSLQAPPATRRRRSRRTDEGQPYFDAFVLPEPERYYSFDWGDIHFVAIDTTHRDTAQVEWLKQDLAKTTQRWKVVFGPTRRSR